MTINLNLQYHKCNNSFKPECQCKDMACVTQLIAEWAELVMLTRQTHGLHNMQRA